MKFPISYQYVAGKPQGHSAPLRIQRAMRDTRMQTSGTASEGGGFANIDLNPRRRAVRGNLSTKDLTLRQDGRSTFGQLRAKVLEDLQIADYPSEGYELIRRDHSKTPPPGIHSSLAPLGAFEHFLVLPPEV